MNSVQTIKKSQKRLMLIIAAALALIVAGMTAALVIFPFLRIRILGISLKPTEDIPLRQITYYFQKDPRWREDIIGTSNSTIGKEGCVITCVSIAVSDLENKTVTPQDFNQMMTRINGYEDASLLWYKISEAIPSLGYRSEREFSRDTVEDDLKGSRLPIVKVKRYGIVGTHWVIIVGAQNGQFLVSDPLNEDNQPIPLSKYGRVYAYRVITKNA